MKLQAVLDLIPEIHEFMTPEEMDESTFALAKQYPDIVQVDQVGESTRNYPIYRLKIGSGQKKALIFGCPHPNEPIGAMMIEHLAKILCEQPALLQELDTTFHLIKCVDPDGLHLNEGWLKGPFTYANYASHFYRPASVKQVEWTFPFHYENYHFDEPLSETKAIMRVIDEVKPDVLYSLHNSSFGGVYWYLTQNNSAVVDHLGAAAQRVDLPLSLGEPEMPFCKTYGDAIYQLPQSADMYEYFKANLDKDPAEVMKGGGCSADYLSTQNPDAFTIICEMPYFFCPDSNNLAPCADMTRKEAILKGFEIQDTYLAELKHAYAKLQPYADATSSCMLALAERCEDHQDHRDAQRALMDANPSEYEVPCTISSRFDNLIGTPWYTLIAFGMVRSAAKQTLNRSDLSEQAVHDLNKLVSKTEQFINEKCAWIDAQVPCQPIAIRKLVSVQMESALLALGMKGE